jgi:hypothetical protein
MHPGRTLLIPLSFYSKSFSRHLRADMSMYDFSSMSESLRKFFTPQCFSQTSSLIVFTNYRLQIYAIFNVITNYGNAINCLIISVNQSIESYGQSHKSH